MFFLKMLDLASPPSFYLEQSRFRWCLVNLTSENSSELEYVPTISGSYPLVGDIIGNGMIDPNDMQNSPRHYHTKAKKYLKTEVNSKKLIQ
jgi:hypothetical protein